MKKGLKIGLSILLSILGVVLLNYNYKWKISLFSFILGSGIFFLVKNYKRKKLDKLIFINGFIFALFLDIGFSYTHGTSLSYLWKNFNNLLLS